MLTTGQIYHVYSRTIAKFEIFHNECDYLRMRRMIGYYRYQHRAISFSKFNRAANDTERNKEILDAHKKIVKIIAYCFMPTHIHLILKQVADNGISNFMNNILNSYTRYFNTKHNRKGPLWESRFKKVLVENDEQLLHLTRYIHLNPTTACLVENLCEWEPSSYREYIAFDKDTEKICEYSDLFQMCPKIYRDFVADRISYQRELAKIKSLIFDVDDE
ncbi:MAG: transposase [Candidatus Omnitrophica bacterium]|nr:transposase [Candidatus Omnitrophota bacterium]